MRKLNWAVGCAVMTGIFAGGASASYHTFRINELYSDATGTVQFIELKEVFGLNGQQFVTLAPDIKSTANDFVFPANLPNSSTASKSFILGTAAYAAIAGAPAPDFTIPANFFNPAGDTLTYGTTGPDGVVDSTTFGTVLSGSNQSLNRVGTFGNTFTAATNTPTNFAGATGSVPEPTSCLLLVGTGLGLMLRHRRGK